MKRVWSLSDGTAVVASDMQTDPTYGEAKTMSDGWEKVSRTGPIRETGAPIETWIAPTAVVRIDIYP